VMQRHGHMDEFTLLKYNEHSYFFINRVREILAFAIRYWGIGHLISILLDLRNLWKLHAYMPTKP